MFTPFFYLLRAHGLNITTHEWLTFLEGLRDGLHHPERVLSVGTGDAVQIRIGL